MPRWTRQVRVSPGIGLEGPLDDGFSWRKYGQKDILGAKYPRCANYLNLGILSAIYKVLQKGIYIYCIRDIGKRQKHTMI